LIYDVSLTFEDNLRRFKEFCRQDQDRRTMAYRLSLFETDLLENVPGNAAWIQSELNDRDVPPYYRTLLVTCLAASGCPVTDSMLWTIAGNDHEDLGVRRRAAALLSTIESRSPHSDECLRLMTCSDRDIRISALLAAPGNMDEEGFAIVRHIANESPDVNERIAAVVAVGGSRFPDSNEFLLDVVESLQTSLKHPYAETALLKRTVVSRLDVADVRGYDAAKEIAADSQEASGVRGRAILKCAEGPPDDAVPFISDLLTGLRDEEVFLIQSAVQALAGMGRADARESAVARIAAIGNDEIKKHLMKILDQTAEANGRAAQ